uniref:Uncharacterized protein n=1 Tax=Myotis myotis TaxID=51298 RepID=A0A7J8AMC2_MYOMY|nr:hypothetical protein mMyoMyo1_008010 [Myotis myotis]
MRHPAQPGLPRAESQPRPWSLGLPFSCPAPSPSSKTFGQSLLANIPKSPLPARCTRLGIRLCFRVRTRTPVPVRLVTSIPSPRAPSEGSAGIYPTQGPNQWLKPVYSLKYPCHSYPQRPSAAVLGKPR